MLDADDNCPDVGNPEQYDEDTDGTGDLCDSCPIVSNLMYPGADNDSDGDQVGDACDPNPMPLDSVMLFEAFHDGAVPAGAVTFGTGTWQFANDTAIADNSAGDTWVTMQFPGLDIDPTTDSFVAYTDVSYDQTAIPAGQNFVQGAGALALGTVDGLGVGCELGFQNAMQGLFATNIGPNADTPLQEAFGPPPGAMILVFGSVNRTLSCFTRDNTMTPPATVPQTQQLGPATGIHARGISATFKYIYVVKSSI